MTDEWYSQFNTAFDNGEVYTERTPFGAYDYQLETPWRVIGSASAIIRNVALLSLEYEFVDYSKSRLSSPGYSFYNENDAIRQYYSGAHTIRLGTEYRLGNVGFRAGGGYYTSPFSDNINDGEKFFFSAGAGIRSGSFFTDIAYLQTFSKEDYYLYGSESVSFAPVQNNYKTYNLMLTFGFRF
jgi:hypothetical protein